MQTPAIEKVCVKCVPMISCVGQACTPSHQVHCIIDHSRISNINSILINRQQPQENKLAAAEGLLEVGRPHTVGVQAE
jgi:hypothetical protein